MKKWITILLGAVLMICLLAGCQPADCEPTDCEPAGTVEFTLEKVFEINDAVWNHLYTQNISKAHYFCQEPWRIEGYETGKPYLGFANGYDFFSLHFGHIQPEIYPPPPAIEVEIGGVLFDGCCESCLYGYKEGKLYRLIDLYESGEISTEDVENIKKAIDTAKETLRMLSSEEIYNIYLRFENEMEENGWEYAHGWEPPEGMEYPYPW